jgi:hypothetical protein
MKKLSLAFTIFLLLTGEVHSQELLPKPKKFHFGILGSINASTLDISNSSPAYSFTVTPENIPKIGYKAGAFVNYNLSKHFFLSSGLSFATSKTKIKESRFFLDESSIAESFYSWIEMPLNMNYIINPKSSCKIFVGSGFSIRRLLNATSNISYESASSVTTATGFEISIYSQLNDWSLMGTVHLGVQLPISEKNSFLLSISIERSLFNMYPYEGRVITTWGYNTYESYFPNMKINSIAFNVNYPLN